MRIKYLEATITGTENTQSSAEDSQKKKGCHSYLLTFGKELEKLYGKDRITTNMHLQTHIIECILDYGPVYSFWLFSFERYNGMLGEYQTNHGAVEIQLMRKFTSELYVKDIQLPSEFKDMFQPLLNKLKTKQVGTLLIKRRTCREESSR
ncbi:predicted protein [Nematostella vectensis]|uniref:Uncharacterized protein n=1 Tax=Nematostella vectensis TaxID=45351 RepID=A7SK59_NEMVE|nr:predicted protein [Nematostella vectensis]|eukprot:XP_001627964.1 predicted protein [Nematostella vectensis]